MGGFDGYLLTVIFLAVNAIFVYRLAVMQLRQGSIGNISTTVNQTINFLESRLSDLQTEFCRIEEHNRYLVDQIATTQNPQLAYRRYLVDMDTRINNAYSYYYEMLDSVSLYIGIDGTMLRKSNDMPTRYTIQKDELSRYEENRLHWTILAGTEQVLRTGDNPGLQFSMMQYHPIRYQDTGTLLQLTLSSLYLAEIFNGADLGEDSGFLLVSGDKIIPLQPAGEKLSAEERFTAAVTALLDGSGGNTFSPEKGISYLLLHDQVSLTGWKVVAYINENTITASATRITVASLLSIGFLLVLFVLVIIAVVKIVTNPLRRIVTRICALEEDSLDIRFDEYSVNKEVHALNRKLSYLISHIKNLLRNIEQEQQKKHQAEFVALQAQINPHFLYNTLYAVQQLCDLRDSDSAGRMVRELARFYRAGISTYGSELSLRQECQIAESYLMINQVRFGEQLSFSIQSEERLLGYSILKMTLQSIIENAIKHAFDGTSALHIAITIRQEGELITCGVTDNGCGIRPERLTQLCRELAAPPNDDREHAYGGIGLRNVNDRLRLFYGVAYGLRVESEYGAGCTVSVEIPAWPARQE